MSFLQQLLSKFHQIIFALIVFGTAFESSISRPITTKRSPLEVGLVSFHDFPKLLPLKRNVTKLDHRTSTKTDHSHHIWIPGYVKGHAFIPAHEEHVLMPTAAVIVTEPIHSITVHSNNAYRSHIGGFGVGVNFGGRGSGHGFHVTTFHF